LLGTLPAIKDDVPERALHSASETLKRRPIPSAELE
jgi:hypothetical protein